MSGLPDHIDLLESMATHYAQSVVTWQEIIDNDPPTTEAEWRLDELRRETIPHFKELARLFNTIAAIGGTVIDERAARDQQAEDHD